MRISLILIFLVSVAFAGPGKTGVVNSTDPAIVPYSNDEGTRAAADWYTMRFIKISDSSTNLTVSTSFGARYVLKGIYNNSGSLATVILTTTTPANTVALKIPAYSYTCKLPPIVSITKSGSSDSLVLFFQYQTLHP